jgi:hypothetical protein
MTPEEQEPMNWLCQRTQEEKDPQTFSALVDELKQMMEQKEDQLPRIRLSHSPSESATALSLYNAAIDRCLATCYKFSFCTRRWRGGLCSPT